MKPEWGWDEMGWDGMREEFLSADYTDGDDGMGKKMGKGF